MSAVYWEYDDDEFELDVHRSVVAAFQEVTTFQAHKIHKLLEALESKNKSFEAHVNKINREHSETVMILQNKQTQLNTRLEDREHEHGAELLALNAELEKLSGASNNENATDHAELQKALGEANDARHELLTQLEAKNRQLEELQASSRKAIEEVSNRLLAAEDVHRKVAGNLQRALGLWDEDNDKSFRALRSAVNLLPKVN